MITAIPVSAGEITDRITILTIKSRKIKDVKKKKQVHAELRVLQLQFKKIEKHYSAWTGALNKLRKILFDINLRLWNAEDGIRKCESEKQFGKKFISLARSIYKLNDKRHQIKQKINSITGSIKESKVYERV